MQSVEKYFLQKNTKMDFHRKAEAALVTNFCVSDSIAQQQMVMLFWWKDQENEESG